MQSKIFPRRCGAMLPVAAGGDGVYLIDADGKRYLDGSSGAAVSCLGHSNRAVAEAVKEQLDKLPYAHTSFFTSEAAEALAEKLIGAAPAQMGRAYFAAGGSEALEAALKLARQYFVERGEPKRRYIIARRQSYHGNTLGALAAGGNAWRRAMFSPLLFGAEHIEECHFWRRGLPGETAAEYAARAADLLEKKINALGAENVAAFVAEPVVGATMGAVAAPAGYFSRIREICDRAGVLFIADEVMCGMGRTGALFAVEIDGGAPDVICIAKGLSAGLQPLAAMLCTDKIYDAIAGGSGFFQHGHTFNGHPAACAAGVAVLEEMEKNNLIAQVNKAGARLEKQLREKLQGHPHIGDIRGRGLFWGVEFVAENKTPFPPFPPGKKIHSKIKQAAFARGLMVYAMGGTIDGENGDHILIAPPFIISDAEIEELTDKLRGAICEVLGDGGGGG